MDRYKLQKKYGIAICDDSYVNPLTGKYVKAYKIFSADGCLWEKGLRSLKAIEAECEEWKEALLKIKLQAKVNRVLSI